MTEFINAFLSGLPDYMQKAFAPCKKPWLPDDIFDIASLLSFQGSNPLLQVGSLSY